MGVLHQDTTILNGQSQSTVLDITDRVILAVELPATWTAANITLLASQTAGGTFLPVKNQDGTDLTITAAAAQVNVISALLTQGLRYVKLRSGTPAAPVVQLADRVINVATQEDDRV